ncbi:MAG: deoxyguanosinetriphosphate triphosphohydrolase [Eubacteriales bacterium]
MKIEEKNARTRLEALEREILSPYATFSADAERERPVEECAFRTKFQRDRDRIIHSKSFRRLKHKTQVFLSPEGDHYRTRLTHTLEVSQIARTMARCLRLNEDLTEAIAMGHDLGHTPFGHAGERALQQIDPEFEHNKHSLRVVKYLENGKGLNLTLAVNDGILKHKKNDKPMTMEGKLINYSDRIAYINHDIDDAIRAGVLKQQDIPKSLTDYFGETHSQRLESMISDIIQNSSETEIRMSKQTGELFDDFRAFMFKRVYFNPVAKSEEGKAERVILQLFEAFNGNPSLMPDNQDENIEKYGKRQAIIDYIASMTDRYVIKVYNQLFVPTGWNVY